MISSYFLIIFSSKCFSSQRGIFWGDIFWFASLARVLVTISWSTSFIFYAGDVRNVGLIPGSERPVGQKDPLKRKCNTFQYSCLGNPTDRGAWQATVHGVAKELEIIYWLNNNNNMKLQPLKVPGLERKLVSNPLLRWPLNFIACFQCFITTIKTESKVPQDY